MENICLQVSCDAELTCRRMSPSSAMAIENVSPKRYPPTTPHVVTIHKKQCRHFHRSENLKSHDLLLSLCVLTLFGRGGLAV
jgi:hypothetical protein